jgi:transcriptional regulator
MYNPQLETFLRVADAGSFNKAAEESYITPTAVIKQINLLEESLGVKLFDRSHRGLCLTKAGRSMYQDSKSTPVRATKKSPIPCVSSTHRVLLKFIFLLVLSCFSILFLTLFFSRI